MLFPDELVRDFANGIGSVFVGAGASIGAGLPGWGELLKALTGQSELPKELSHLDVAQYYENDKGRQRLVDDLWNLLQSSDRQPTAIHHDVVRLPVRRIFTTNLDSLLESAALHNKRTPRKITNTDPSVTTNPEHLSIFKLHGDLDQRPSYVITADDYEGYATKYRTSVLMMSYEFHTSTVLFVGYSFNDFDLRMILKEVSTQAGPLRRRHYALFTDPSPAVGKDLDRRGIQVIPIDTGGRDRTAAVHAWLAGFSEKIEEFRRGVQSSRESAAKVSGATAAPVAFRPPAPSYRKLVGRDKEIRNVEEGLAAPRAKVIIEGLPGSGKTSLALEVISRHHRAKPDGPAAAQQPLASSDFEHVVWISRGSPGQKRFLDEVIAAVIVTINGIHPSGDVAESRREATRLLESHRVLLVIDNFGPGEDSELVNWLDELPESSRVLITTRRLQTAPFGNAVTVHLGGLDHVAATEFLSATADDLVRSEDAAALRGLMEITGGNPQALLLAVGLARSRKVKLADIDRELRSDNPEAQLGDALFKQLFATSFAALSSPAKRMIQATSLFSALRSIQHDALAEVSGVDQPSFDAALQELDAVNLLEDNNEGRAVVHPLIRVFARTEFERLEPRERFEMHRRQRDYYLKFIRRHAVRNAPVPLPPYWNALVSASMARIDPEWPAIAEVLKWVLAEKQWESLIEFVMLTVHYMDSRFLNEERLKYVHEAVRALSELNRKSEEALLRIDALGWTYIEEGRPDEAKKEINAGFTIAHDLENADLMALAYSWLARIATEAGDNAAATGLIQTALGMKTSPWIWYRVNMAAGDIAYSEDRCERALQFYQTAANKVEEYGGEEGYQIETRLGLAWVGLGNLDEAKSSFDRISGLGQIAIGQLHAKYGLALVAKKKGDLDKGKQLAEEVRRTLMTRTKSSLLLKMINKLFQPADFI